MQIDAAKFHIEFVEHAVIANAQFEFGSALQSLVRKGFQSCANFIHFMLRGFADGKWQSSKAFENVGDQI